MEIMPDHIHLMVIIPPEIAVSEAIKRLKGRTARYFLLAHPEIRESMFWDEDPHLWQPSYYIGSVGNMSKEIVRKYIRRQKEQG